MVVEGSIALGDGLELVVEVEDYGGERHVIVQLHAVGGDVVLADERAATVQAELHDRAEELRLGDDLRADERLFDMVYQRRGRQSGRVVHVDYLALRGVDLVGNVGNRGDDVHIKLPEEALLHDFEVQQAQEAAAEAGSEGERTFRFVDEGGVVELEFLKHGAQLFEL